MNYIKSIYETENTPKENIDLQEFTTVNETMSDHSEEEEESLPVSEADDDNEADVEYDDEHCPNDDTLSETQSLDIDYELSCWDKKLELIRKKYEYYKIEKKIVEMYMYSNLPDDIIMSMDMFSHISDLVIKEKDDKKDKNFFIRASKTIKDMLTHHDALLKMSFVANAAMSMYIGIFFYYLKR